MQASESIHEAKSAQGFTALGILVENSRGKPPGSDDLRTWTKAYSVTFPVLADPGMTTFAAYVPRTALPASFLVGRDGVIRYAALGTIDDATAAAKLEAEIDAALAEPSKSTGG